MIHPGDTLIVESDSLDSRDWLCAPILPKGMGVEVGFFKPASDWTGGHVIINDRPSFTYPLSVFKLANNKYLELFL